LDKISILSLDGRLIIPIVYGSYAKLEEKVIKNSAKLIYKKGSFYLQAAVETPKETLKEVSNFLGVDLGIVNLATTSDGICWSGDKVEDVRVRFNTLRADLQSCGSKSAKRHLKIMSGKERRFKKNVNHIISNQIVAYAKALNLGIALEELKGFKATVNKKQKDRFGKWTFYELASFIIYKAARAGVLIMKVDPRNTSRTCSNCGHCEKGNRSSQSKFKCKACGFQINADINGAINISKRAVVNQLIAAGQLSDRAASLEALARGN
jgi:IS605 OrfB family transposase